MDYGTIVLIKRVPEISNKTKKEMLTGSLFGQIKRLVVGTLSHRKGSVNQPRPFLLNRNDLYVNFITRDMFRRGLKSEIGINEDVEDGGFFVSRFENFSEWKEFGNLVAFAKIPECATIEVEKTGIKTNKIDIVEIVNLDLAGKWIESFSKRSGIGISTLCNLAVKHNRHSIGYIPVSMWTQYIYEVAVSHDEFTINLVPYEMRTASFFEAIVSRNGLAIQVVPEEMRTVVLCIIAVRQTWRAFEYVPLSSKTSYMCEIAVKQNWRAIGSVPEVMLTSRLCKIAIKQNGISLGCISETERSSSLCNLAVKQNGLAIQYVPEKHRTIALYKAAMHQNWLSIRYIPESYHGMFVK